MRRIFGNQEDDEQEINITPLLDVVFIILIFFIVTASFVKEWGLDASRPDTQPQVIQERSNILIVITQNDEIMIDARVVDPRALRANIERMRAENPQASVVVQPHRQSRTRTVVTAMDAARQAGIFNVSLATQE